MKYYVLLTGADKENLQPRSSKNSRHEALAEGRMLFEDRGCKFSFTAQGQ